MPHFRRYYISFLLAMPYAATRLSALRRAAARHAAADIIFILRCHSLIIYAAIAAIIISLMPFFIDYADADSAAHARLTPPVCFTLADAERHAFRWLRCHYFRFAAAAIAYDAITLRDAADAIAAVFAIFGSDACR